MALMIGGKPIRTGWGPQATKERQAYNLKMAKATGERAPTFMESAFGLAGDVLGEPDTNVNISTPPDTDGTDYTPLVLGVVGLGVVAAVWQLST